MKTFSLLVLSALAYSSVNSMTLQKQLAQIHSSQDSQIGSAISQRAQLHSSQESEIGSAISQERAQLDVHTNSLQNDPCILCQQNKELQKQYQDAVNAELNNKKATLNDQKAAYNAEKQKASDELKALKETFNEQKAEYSAQKKEIKAALNVKKQEYKDLSSAYKAEQKAFKKLFKDAKKGTITHEEFLEQLESLVDEHMPGVIDFDAPRDGSSGDDGSNGDNGSTGDGSTGDDSTGDDSTGDGSAGDDSTGDDSLGDGSTGDDSTGDGSAGDGSAGDGSTGDGSDGDGSNGDDSADDTGDADDWSTIQGKTACDKTNEYRVSQGLEAIAWDQDLHDICVPHSDGMADGSIPFSHQGFGDRVSEYRTVTGQGGASAENVAMNWSGPEAAVEQWIGSDGHRKNMIGNYNRCAVAVSKTEAGAWYFTQMFIKV